MWGVLAPAVALVGGGACWEWSWWSGCWYFSAGGLCRGWWHCADLGTYLTPSFPLSRLLACTVIEHIAQRGGGAAQWDSTQSLCIGWKQSCCFGWLPYAAPALRDTVLSWGIPHPLFSRFLLRRCTAFAASRYRGRPQVVEPRCLSICDRRTICTWNWDAMSMGSEWALGLGVLL